MKILSLHINNYGKFSNYDLKFDELTSICEKNGFGKTTLSSFIKAMFYGLDKVTSASTKFLDRKHFNPFNGGVFGGNIEFEYNNKTYRIERTFDAKSNTKDTIKVYCNNTLDNDALGPIPGNTVFGINRDSFERLISINSDKITIETDDDINRKLNNYVENIGEDFDIENVKKKIKDSIKNNKKKIDDLKTSIKTISLDISEKEYKKKELDDTLYNELNSVQVLKNKAETEYELSAKSGTLVEKWKRYKSLLNEIKDKQEEKKTKESEYISLPTIEEIQEAKEIEKNITSLKELSSNNVLLGEQLNKYNSLKERFKDRPDKETLSSISDKVKIHEKIKNDINKYEEQEETAEEKELSSHFFGESIQELNDKKEELNEEVQNYIELKKDQTIDNSNTLNKSNSSSTLTKPQAIIGVLMIIVGIVVLFNNITIGVIVIILGFLSLFGAAYLKLSNNINNFNNTGVAKTNNSITKTKEIELKNLLINKFANYKYNGDNPELLMYQFENDLKKYKEIIIKNEKNQKIYDDNVNKLKQLSSELENFFNNYSIYEQDYSFALSKLNTQLTLLNNFEDTIKEKEVDKNKKENEISELQSKLDNFLKKYGIKSNKSLSDVLIDINDVKRLSKEIDEKTSEAEKYKENNQLVEEPKDEAVDLEKHKAERDFVIERFNKIKQNVEEIEDDIINLDDLKNELDEKKEMIKSLSDKVDIYNALLSELEKSDQKLKDKYIAPIKDKFEYYANIIENAIGDRVRMDKDYRISFEREGEFRSYEHLSNGNLTICALCFRLAILDNMFEDELPFILMDDPFVHLDKDHFEKTKKLIEDLSKNKQIIYFCCHDSRKL